MKLKKKTDYTLRTLIFIINSDKRSKIQEISDYYKISKNHLKVIVNQLSTLEIIFSYSGPNVGIEINKTYSNGDNILLKAVRCDKFDVVKILLKNQHIDVNNSNSNDSVTALYLASVNGNTNIVRCLLKCNNIDVNKTNSIVILTLLLASITWHHVEHSFYDINMT